MICPAFSGAGTHHFGSRYLQIIQAVTVEEVNAAIRKYFRPDHLTVVIAGDYEDVATGAALTTQK